ncbi:Epimerase domain-containing protein [Mycena chlorophos]|uniref:Epimerase domain-containing protein n=1 Tax=Mycena chlorophos TaxID=658473 RepID=A0A8H6SDP9_MYCCL|nr:Epimerase domain-containing protein [Mycena chlorophos]
MSLLRYPIHVLLTGATGYIGGSTLSALLAREDYKDGRVKITCLVRGGLGDRAALIERLGVDVTVLVGDLADWELLRAAAAEADGLRRRGAPVVIDTANADFPRGARAMLAGLRQRYERTGTRSVFIHSSGTGALTDNAQGKFADQKIYDDLDCTAIRAIPTTYVHRETDELISQASVEGYVRGYVVMPPLVYGRGTGPCSRTSVQIPALIRAALTLGQAVHVGSGLSMWNGVHVNDLVSLFMVLLDDALSAAGPKAPTGLDCYYFCATDTYSWKQLAGELGKRLYAKGALPTPEPRALRPDEERVVLGEWSGFAYGSNSRSRAGKAYTLGWVPKHGTRPTNADANADGLFDSIDAEYEAVLEEGRDVAPKVHSDEMNVALGTTTYP